MQAIHRPAGFRAFSTANVRQLRRARPCRAQKLAALTAHASTRVEAPTLPALDGSYESNVSFTDFANWLVPGSVLLGRYPYVEPSRCLRREQGEEQMKRILEVGVTTFVSLQAELPPQEKITLAGSHGFLPYKATADLIRSSLNGPPPMEIVEGLRNPYLNTYLPQRKRQGAPYNPLTLQFVHSAIPDLDVPHSPELRQLLQDLQKRLAAGEVLYVHCWGGRGRAGTVGACLLAEMYDLSADECLERVQRAFDTRLDGGRRSPETEEQVAFVHGYISGLKN